MAETTTYLTTKLCGRRVAGRPVEEGKAGQKLDLTPDEAANELLEGTVVEKDGGKLHAAFGAKSEKADAIRSEVIADRATREAERARRPPAPVEVVDPAAPTAPAAKAAPADPAPQPPKAD